MEEPIVTVKQGKLKGRTGTDYDGRKYYSFQGIPYAKPPVGKLRFRPPQPSDPWEGIRDATIEGNICSQRNYTTSEIIGSEDCLYLNVYTPELPLEANSTLKPVMLWIYGGAFTIGSGNSDSYGPEYLLINDVVVITINYRLGLLGFLKADDPTLEIPGNAGLRDIVMALRWVNSNIQQFSGDPNNVTIFGENAGSVAVQYILLSPLSRGLFHKAIMQSGSVFNLWASGYQNSQVLAEKLNIDTSSEKEIIETLAKLSVEKLLELQEQLGDTIAKGIKRPFGPTVEKPNLDPFITKEPYDILASGEYNDVPTIIGYCKREGNLCEAFANLEERKPIHSSFDKVVPPDLNLTIDSVEFKEVSNKIKEFYYKEVSQNTTETYSILEGDVHFIVGISRSIRLMLEKSEQPIYCYRFSIDTSLNMLRKVLPVTLSGASHGDDLSYLFKSELNPEIKIGSVEDVAIRRISRLWTNFAKTSDPNSRSIDPLLNVQWKPISKTEHHFLDFDKTLTVGADPDGDRMTFWHEIYKTYSNR